MPLKRSLIFILLMSLGLGAQAYERRYMAAMEDSEWTLTDDSAILCRAEHPIPRFGKAIFSQEAGRGLRLELISRLAFKRGINVELRSKTTSWNAHETRAVLGRFETRGGNSLFKISSSIAEQTFFELGRGFHPSFLFYLDYPLVASISTVRFGEVEKEFNRCVAQLYQRNYEDVRMSSIHFEPDHEFASIRQEETAFQGMLDYLQVDQGISEILVTGHADNTGLACYNDGLSERRAWYVYDLLVACGIDSSLLRVDYAGEYQPVIKASGKKFRAANRRVTVELRCY